MLGVCPVFSLGLSIHYVLCAFSRRFLVHNFEKLWLHPYEGHHISSDFSVHMSVSELLVIVGRYNRCLIVSFLHFNESPSNFSLPLSRKLRFRAAQASFYFFETDMSSSGLAYARQALAFL